MSEKITPRVDIAFKKIFGVEENKDLLISLINSIVSQEDQVENITLLNPYNPRNFKNDKLSILDIKAVGCNQKRYNIEIQISDEADYDKRALYYWAKLYTEQLEKNTDYSELNKAIGIHILNFISIPEVKKYHNIFDLRERESGIHYFKDIELHTIELSKFEENAIKSDNKKLSKAEELAEMLSKIRTSLDKWVAFLTRHDLLDKKHLPNKLSDPKLEKALDILDEMNFTRDERDSYEAHLKWIRIEANTLKKVRRDSLEEGMQIGMAEGMQIGMEEGMQIGMEEGMQIGMEEGMQIGMEKGKAEGLVEGKAEVVKKMSAEGLDINIIAKVTDLTIEEIKVLLK